MIILSANCWDQPPDSKPKPLDALPLYIPTVASTSAYLIKKKTQGKTKGVPAKITLDQINKQVINYGFACCMIHPQEFEQEDRTINYRQIKQLRKVIDGVVTKGFTIAWFSDLANLHLDSLQWRTNISQFPQEKISMNNI